MNSIFYFILGRYINSQTYFSQMLMYTTTINSAIETIATMNEAL
jgi:hypothetical protein